MKRHRNEWTVLIIAFTITLFAWAESPAHQQDSLADSDDSTSVNQISDDQSFTESSSTELAENNDYQETNEEDVNSSSFDDAIIASLPRSTQLDVPFINQFPELPTGCEITSLAEALHYYGYDIDKESLASNYLTMKTTRSAGCFIEFFLGSPWSENGSGCFAPAITDAANRYLLAQSSSLTAKALDYASVYQLFEEVANGYPVIVWTTTDYTDKEITYRQIPLDDGEIFSWPENEHCVVLSGYNLDLGTVTLTDPTYGIIEHSIDDFSYFYRKYFYQAVVLQ